MTIGAVRRKYVAFCTEENYEIASCRVHIFPAKGALETNLGLSPVHRRETACNALIIGHIILHSATKIML